MAEKTRPLSNADAPDPSFNYERSHPEREAGMGRLDNNKNTTPRRSKDHIADAVTNAQDGSKQLNAHENDQASNPNHAAANDQPLGWDKAKKSAPKK